jgi:hypothetical protein
MLIIYSLPQRHHTLSEKDVISYSQLPLLPHQRQGCRAGKGGGEGISGFYILYPLSCLLPNLIYFSNLFIYLRENNLER